MKRKFFGMSVTVRDTEWNRLFSDLLLLIEKTLADAKAENESLSSELEEANEKLQKTTAELTDIQLNYQNLLDEKNEFQKALEAIQDEINVRVALAEQEAEAEANAAQTDLTDIDKANEQIRDYYEQMEKLQDSMLQLQIENTLLREYIDEFTY